MAMRMRHFRAPAKINLCLHVLGRRSDGYHELRMLMQKVSLYDEVWINARTDGRICVECDGIPLPEGEENIALRAARALLSDSSGAGAAGMGVDIRIEKHIPVAAGLGGGSSDAATVLLALNELFHLDLKPEKLAHIALKLGADVPFFLGPSPAWAEGVGEELTPLETKLPPAYFVLVNPNVALSTAQVYAHVETYSDCARKGVCIDTIEMLVAALHNDLESAAMQLCPQINKVKTDLLECGARGALMSGSGATVFGVFDSCAAAENAAHYLKTTRKWWACVVTAVA